MDSSDRSPSQPGDPLGNAGHQPHLERECARNHIARSARIDPAATIGKGVTIEEGVKIGPRVTIGDYVTVMADAHINHGTMPGRKAGDVIVGERTFIGPQAIIHGDVTIGPRNIIEDRAIIGSYTTLGRGNWIHSMAYVGSLPQDRDHLSKYDADAFYVSRKDALKIAHPTFLEIGDRNTIFPFVDISIGTVKSRQGRQISWGVTRIGNHNLLMKNCHFGHDVEIGDECTFGNGTQFAGHAVAGNYVTLTGGTNIAAFRVLGAYAHTPLPTNITSHLPPYMTAWGERARVTIPNVEGVRAIHTRLSRHLTESERVDWDVALRTIFKNRSTIHIDTIDELCREIPVPEIQAELRWYCQKIRVKEQDAERRQYRRHVKQWEGPPSDE